MDFQPFRISSGTADDLNSALNLPGDAAAQPAAAPTGAYSSVYAFGDSLSDVGNDHAASLGILPSAPYVDGHFTNGAVWVQDLAAQLGVSAPAASLQGGTDFAYGGAETGQDPLHAASALDLPSQLAQFTLANPVPDGSALYTLSIGSNDVIDATSAYSANPASATADIAQAVGNETAFIQGLADRGAQNLLVLNVPDIGKAPEFLSQGAVASQTASSLSALYDAELNNSLASLAASDHLNLHIADTFGLLDQGVANPAAFGLSNVTQPVWTGNYTDPGSGALNATGAAQNGYLFFDNLHPTATGHALLASAAYNSLATTV